MPNEIETFTLHGVREVMPLEAVHLERIVSALEQALTENHGLAFDLSKSLIETACKTIIKDRGQEYSANADLPHLIRSAMDLVCIIPEDVDDSNEAQKSLRKTVNGIMTSIQGICELRRLFGEASHGRDAYFSQIERDHALMVARSADVIVNYLFRMHKATPIGLRNQRMYYGRNSSFNDWIDDQNDAVKIFDFRYKPSEVLFNIDHDAYRDLLIEFESDGSLEENPDSNSAEGSNTDE
ncbi:MAG TPA: abortive infection family protein [Candidatus Cloacimonadota bacterium]|nr:abortive infection family protein [Candidatus Cloacimonadota bacterium]